MADISYHGPVVAFDLDDTLFRERDFCRSGFRYLCDPSRYRIEGIKEYPDAECLDRLRAVMDEELLAGRNPFTPFENFFRPLTGSVTWNLQEHIYAYRNHRPDALHYADGVKEVLDRLVERGIRMAVVTDGRAGTQRRKIEALGLDSYVAPDLIFISEETGHDKKDKEAFAAVVRRLPEARSFVYVGDNPEKDFYWPNLLGWTTLQTPPHSDNVHSGAAPLSPLHSPKTVLTHFSEILDYI